jgi:hypothetical protein
VRGYECPNAGVYFPRCVLYLVPLFYVDPLVATAGDEGKSIVADYKTGSPVEKQLILIVEGFYILCKKIMFDFFCRIGKTCRYSRSGALVSIVVLVLFVVVFSSFILFF